MSRALILLNGLEARRKATAWIAKAPINTRVTFAAPKRSLPQNAKMWSMLSDIAQQKTYHGLKLTAEDYKLIFLDALASELRIVPNIDGTGFVNLGRSSSNLSKEEFGDLFTVIEEWGARNGVVFNEPQQEVAA